MLFARTALPIGAIFSPGNRSRVLALTWSLVLASAVAGCTAIGPAPTPTPTATVVPVAAPPTSEPSPNQVLALHDIGSVVDRVLPSVVSVITTVERRDFFGRIVEGASTGSGIIIDDQGHIITNNHVVEGGTKVEVTLHQEPKQSWPVTVVGADPLSDLAVLRLDPDSVPFALAVTPLGDSEALRVGEWVVAIGSPLGFSGTVTLGIVSAKGRSLDLGSVNLIDLIQTDALINPGNSGGPLLDLNAEVVGINTATIRGAVGGGVEAEGLGFAVSATVVKLVADQLIASGEVAWPLMGVTVGENNPAQAVELGLNVEYGVVIESIVPGGPADEAGIRPRDVVTALDEEEIQTVTDLLQALRIRYKVGDTVATTIVRGDEEHVFDVVLERLER